MTISTSPRVSLNCDGVTKVFPVAIQAYQASDITVILTAPASVGGGSIVLTLNSDYSLSASGTLNPPAQTLTTLAANAFATGYTLQCFINPVQQQQSQYVQGQAFPSLVVQTNFDRLTQMVLRLQDELNRALIAPDGDVSPVTALPVAVSRANMALLFDSFGNTTVGTPVAGTITGQIIANLLNLITTTAPTADKVRTPAEIAAGVTPTNFAYAPTPKYDVRRVGMVFDGVTDDTSALNKAISVLVNQTSSSGTITGGQAAFPTGTSILSSTVALPNNVRIGGVNVQSTKLLASASFSGSYVFHASNGSLAMFGSLIEDLAIDCNNVSGLGGILTDAWQEVSGCRRTLIFNIGANGTGIKLQNGFGGASFCAMRDIEIFGGGGANMVGIDVEAMGTSGAFVLSLSDVSIASGTANLLKAINIVNCQTNLHTVHIEQATHGVYLNGNGNHSLIGCTGGTTVTNFVTLDPNFTGTLTMIGCFRNGATILVNDLRVKQISQFGAITGGSGYTNGTYSNVPLTGGTGTTAQAQIVVSGGAVTSVTISQPGTNYAVADSLSAAAANIGGTGSGFSFPVTQVFTGVGAISGDYGLLQLGPPATNSSFVAGNFNARGQGLVQAWGVYDGTVTGTNPCQNSFGVTSVQRTGTGRYTVTLNRNATTIGIIPVATCASPLLTVSTSLLGANTFGIAIDNSSTGVATDSNEIKFIAAGL